MQNKKATIPSDQALDYIRERGGTVTIDWTWIPTG